MHKDGQAYNARAVLDAHGRIRVAGRGVQAAARARGGPVQVASRKWASANSLRYGQAEAIATLIRRAE